MSSVIVIEVNAPSVPGVPELVTLDVNSVPPACIPFRISLNLKGWLALEASD